MNLENGESSSCLFHGEESSVWFPGVDLGRSPSFRRYVGNQLPHWSCGSVVYHVSFRLADSVPMSKQREWLAERYELTQRARLEHRGFTEEEKERLQYLYSHKIEYYLDAGYGACLLRDERVAEIVKQSLEYYNEEKYLLHAWCIMPNHVHTAMELWNGHEQREVLHGWKSYTAHAINKCLGRKGNLWQADYYNHIIRSWEEYGQQLRYIWNNPLQAGLYSWKWRWRCCEPFS